jgi:hypothetical protein
VRRWTVAVRLNETNVANRRKTAVGDLAFRFRGKEPFAVADRNEVPVVVAELLGDAAVKELALSKMVVNWMCSPV